MEYVITSSFNEEANLWDVELSGEFDIFNSAELKSMLTDLTKEHAVDLRVDCAKVRFLDSTAMGSLVAVLKNVKTYDGKMTLLGLNPNISRLFKITRLDRVFEIEGDSNG